MYKLLQKTLATAGAEQLTATSTPCRRAIIQAERSNRGSLMIGDSTVTATKGHELPAPFAISQANAYSLPLILEGIGQNDVNLSNVYAIGTSGDIINILYYDF
jgi:hypothetical protein